MKATHKQLQESFIEEYEQDSIAYKQLELMKDMIDEHFTEKTFSDKHIDNSDRKIPLEKDYIHIRALAGYYACNLFVSKLS
mgnify:CR=1 FL=1